MVHVFRQMCPVTSILQLAWFVPIHLHSVHRGDWLYLRIADGVKIPQSAARRRQKLFQRTSGPKGICNLRVCETESDQEGALGEILGTAFHSLKCRLWKFGPFHRKIKRLATTKPRKLGSVL